MTSATNNNGAPSQTPRRIIVHSMAEYLAHEGEVLHAPDFITAIGLSAHAYVCPDGSVIRQRDDTQGAWHAKGHNTDSLGVEILVAGQWDYGAWLEAIEQPWCEDAQLLAAADLVAQWASMWGIDPARIERHSDVDPDRKYDPGAGFDWALFRTLVA